MQVNVAGATDRQLYNILEVCVGELEQGVPVGDAKLLCETMKDTLKNELHRS